MYVFLAKTILFGSFVIQEDIQSSYDPLNDSIIVFFVHESHLKTSRNLYWKLSGPMGFVT